MDLIILKIKADNELAISLPILFKSVKFKKQTKLIKQKQNDTLRAEATFSRFELSCEK